MSDFKIEVHFILKLNLQFFTSVRTISPNITLELASRSISNYANGSCFSSFQSENMNTKYSIETVHVASLINEFFSFEINGKKGQKWIFNK